MPDSTRQPAAAGGPKLGSACSSAQEQQQQAGHPPAQGLKVAIPRLRRPSGNGDDGSGSSGGADKHRVSHACEPCRQRKTKCSGERPVCKHCQDFKLSCIYADGKRDRAKTEMITLKSKVELYETLLDQLSAQVDSAGQLAIQKALQGEHSPTTSIPPRHVEKNRDGESLVTADIGSTGSVDHIKEDLNSENTLYPTGYMGKNSEVSWIQRVAQQLADEATEQSPKDHSQKSGEGIYTENRPRPRRASVSGVSGASTKQQESPSLADDEYEFQTPTYHLDDLSVSITGGQVDPFTLPPKELADELLNVFFVTTHPSFPIVLKKLFMTQYQAFSRCFFPPGSSKRWLAMLNLMFAIGSLYGRLVDASWKGEPETDHLKYFARARILSLDEGSIFEMADLQQVQVIGLAGIYLVASNQTNRAWNVVGLAIRYAQTLGLNLRNDVPGLDEVEKEMRVRMWYSIYSLEHFLCIMTGRPSAIQDRDCSVPLPRPIDEEQFDADNAFEAALRQHSEIVTTPSSSPKLASPGISSSQMPANRTPAHSVSRTPVSQTPLGVAPGFPTTAYVSTYFLEHTKLNKIATEVLSELYSADTINKSWSDVQGIISALELKIMTWRANLPPMLDFGKKRGDQVYHRNRMCLAFQYHYTRIIINRPCLCRLDYRIPNESNRSRGFNRSAAAACVEAARESIALLPDEPDPVGLISISPWWCLLHYLVSAGVIVMVEMAMRAEHNPQQADGLLRDAKKIVKWLRALAKDNIAAERSCAVLTKLLIVAAPKIGGDTSDVQQDIGLAQLSTTREGNSKFGSSTGGAVDGHHIDGEEHHLAGGLIVEHPAELSDIFRNLVDPLNFGPIPMHTHFDDSLAMDYPAQFAPPQSAGGYSSNTQSNGYSLGQTPANILYPAPEQITDMRFEEYGESPQAHRKHSPHGEGMPVLPPLLPLPPQDVYSGPNARWDGFGTIGAGLPGRSGYEEQMGLPEMETVVLPPMKDRASKRSRGASDSYS